ncbi:MAG: hypothetical protein PUD24_06150 [Oscillospiraceae bacterium]|nr:hypothetical protein [Oscillospiraceae bacterium]
MYSMNEPVDFQGSQAIFTSGKIIYPDEIKKNEELKESVETFVTTDIDNMKIFVVNCTLCNQTEGVLSIDLTSVHLESNEFSLAAFMPLFRNFNDDAMQIELQPNEIKTLTLPIPVNKISFSEKKWKILEERDFYMVDSLYPIKKMVRIDFVKSENV